MELTELVKCSHELGGAVSCLVSLSCRKFGFARTGTTLRELTDPAVQQVGRTVLLAPLLLVLSVESLARHCSAQGLADSVFFVCVKQPLLCGPVVWVI